jgi:bifunctional non-homologous end joining protein LigD
MAKDEDWLTLNGREVHVTSLDKPFFPDAGISKGDVIDYYRRIAEHVVPLWRDRPISLQRFPDGIGQGGFFQKQAGDYFPDWLRTTSQPKEGGTVDYAMVQDAASLVYLANQGTITFHIGLSRVDAIDKPDRMVFDLDPSDGDFAKVQRAARLVRDAMDDAGFDPWVQTTGSKGLHIIAPLDAKRDFDTVREEAQAMARVIAEAAPDLTTVEQRKAKRGDRVFLDVGRNAYGQTHVGPYSLRANPGAPIATPLDWDEALAGDMHPQRYTLKNIFRRLAHKR